MSIKNNLPRLLQIVWIDESAQPALIQAKKTGGEWFNIKLL